MKMPLEIELKIKVDSFDDIVKKLSSLGASLNGDCLQTDYYFDDSEASLVDSDRCLRIREETCNGDEQVSLTYKGARENHRFKSRRELGIGVEKAEEMAAIFTAIGYTQTLAFQKKRSIWQIDNCDVALDELPLLGRFVEIEGPDDSTIISVQEKIALGHHSHIEHSYAHLIEEKLNQTNSGKRELFF